MQEEISFGTWLRKQRRALDLSQKALANQVGCAEVTLRRIEEGTLKPSKELANILLEKLGVSESERPQWIFFARGLAGIPLLSSLASTKSFDGYCPYKGLDVFEEEDAELFFGREGLVQELVERVKESRTLFIIGPSGSGKSSLIRAGLIYALKQGAIKSLHSERWLYETMKPGRDPIGELARITSSMAGTTKAGDELRNKAFADHGILQQWCEIALKEGGNKRVILFIDQFEEIFSEVSNEEERLTFINLVTQAATAENGRVIVLFAMRSDFVMNCATYPKLNALFNQQSIQIGAMEPAELANAIARPALNVDLRIDRDLIEEIIEDMRGEPGALPLMQFALKDLFDSQQARGGGIDLTLNDYRQHGGLHRSLERHADRAFAKLQANEQELARSIFSGLIEIGRGTQDTRRTALLNELIPSTSTGEDVKAVVRKLADARLITTDEVAGKDTITISHEKLMDAWPWLKKLVDENRDAIALQNEIANDVKEWEEHGRDPSYLYTGVRLINSYERLNANKFIVSSTAYDFLQRGFLRQQHAQRTRFFGISGVIGLIVAGIILFAYISATNSSKLAEQSQNSASTQIVLASTSQAIANTAQANFEEAQKQANIALAGKLAAQAQSLYATGNSRQVTAVLLAVRSMQTYPSIDAANILQNNTLARHIVFSLRDDSLITSIAFSRDGKYVVSGSGDGTARVWETTTGQEVARITHDDAVKSVAFSPDGKYVVSGSGDGTARVWETSTGQEVARITHDDAVNFVAFSPDGKYVLSVNASNFFNGVGTIYVWEVRTSQEVARITHNSGITSVAFSLDGKYVVSAGYYTARVWDTMSGQEVARMTHGGLITFVAFSPDGKYVVSGSDDKTARVWDAATGQEVARMTHEGLITSVAFSPDGKYVVSGSDDKTARVWEATTGQEVARITHDDVVNSVAFSPDGKYVVSGSGDWTARVWNAMSGKEVARLTHDSPVSFVAFSPDGKYVLSAGFGTVQIWKADSNKEFTRLTHADEVNSVAFNPDGKYVASGSGDGTARVWEAATGQEVARITHDDVVNSVAFSPDGKYVASGSDDKTARVWEATTGQEVARLTHESHVSLVAFVPVSKYLLSVTRFVIRVWDVRTSREVVRMTHEGPITSVAFSPDGKYVVSGSGDYTARVWDAMSGKEVVRLTHDGVINSVAFSPDGKYVASGSGDGTARVWDAATGKEIARMKHSDGVYRVAFSPDGKYVLSVSGPHSVNDRVGTIDVWKVKTSQKIAHMTHDGVINSVAFSPDGKYVVSGSSDWTARVWDAMSGQEIARMTYESPVSFVAFDQDGDYIQSIYYKNMIHRWIWQPDRLIANTCTYITRNLTFSEWQRYIGGGLPYQAICPNLPIES